MSLRAGTHNGGELDRASIDELTPPGYRIILCDEAKKKQFVLAERDEVIDSLRALGGIVGYGGPAVCDVPGGKFHVLQKGVQSVGLDEKNLFVYGEFREEATSG